MEQATARVADVPTPLRELWDADSCPVALLPWMAWAYSVDQWDATWSHVQQREAIKRSVSIHRYKGTIGAVRDALDALGVDAQVQEWFQQIPPGEPYTFRLLLNASQVGVDQQGFARINEVVQATKNLRSHLDEIAPTITTPAGPVVAAVASLGNEITLLDPLPDLFLLMEGVASGMEETEAAVDSLHTQLHVTMPAGSYW